MLTTYEEELKDCRNQLDYLIANTKELKKEDREHIKGLIINLMIDVHKYLKNNDLKFYIKLLEDIADKDD